MIRIKAGASAEAKYDELARSWRRRKRRLLRTVAAICLTVFTLAVVGWFVWPEHAFVFGIFGGAAMTFWMALHDSPPEWIERWQLAAWSEQKTAKRLKQLEREGWVVINDLRRGKGNVDHLIVGPGGVFVLDTKRTDGVVEVAGDHVSVTRIDDPDLHFSHPGAAHVVRLAAETNARLRSTARINQWVTPVVVWWAQFPQAVAEGRCTHVHGDALVDWLRGRPQRIAPARVPQIADAVRAGWSADVSAPTSGSERLRPT